MQESFAAILMYTSPLNSKSKLGPPTMTFEPRD